MSLGTINGAAIVKEHESSRARWKLASRERFIVDRRIDCPPVHKDLSFPYGEVKV